jgi:hypothetical protein
MTRKRRRQEPPEFISLATLAHRLEIGARRAESYVKSGFLPRPRRVGDLDRWYWPEVVGRLAGGELQEQAEAADDGYSARIAQIKEKTRASAA